jgi:hypothetical protein
MTHLLLHFLEHLLNLSTTCIVHHTDPHHVHNVSIDLPQNSTVTEKLLQHLLAPSVLSVLCVKPHRQTTQTNGALGKRRVRK